MRNFIEVTTGGKRVYQNVNLISNIYESSESAATIQTTSDDDSYKVDQSYNEVKDLIIKALMHS
jgi:hypothetical protein